MQLVKCAGGADGVVGGTEVATDGAVPMPQLVGVKGEVQIAEVSAFQSARVESGLAVPAVALVGGSTSVDHAGVSQMSDSVAVAQAEAETIRVKVVWYPEAAELVYRSI